MNPKQKSMKMHLFYCLAQLLLEVLDDLKVTNPRMIEMKSNLTEMCELLNDECKDTFAIQKTNYFSNISNKIYTIMRKEFDQTM